ncbi:MAG: hypothetical protein RL398_744 [Planctomycetota bacterium]
MSESSYYRRPNPIWRTAKTVVGAVALTAVFFFVLPLTQAIGAVREDDLLLREVDVANLPPPPPPPEPQQQEEEKPETPPELSEAPQPLDLSTLELALNPGMGGGLGGDFAIKLDAIADRAGDVDQIFSLSDLDQKPRAIVQTSPQITPQMRKKGGATVYVLFTVNELGRVESPIVQTPGDPMFDNAAMAAVKQWRFEPGKRKGQPVRFRVRQPITFPK